MKSKNFPARKKARQLAANLRKDTCVVFTAGCSCREELITKAPEVVAARSIRTKKDRSG